MAITEKEGLVPKNDENTGTPTEGATLEDLTKRLSELEAVGSEAIEKVATLETENQELKDRLAKVDSSKNFRGTLSPSLQKAFDEMGDDEKKSFMDRIGKNAADPILKVMEDITKRSEAQDTKIADLETAASVTKMKEDLADLDGSVNIEDFAKHYIALHKVNSEAAEAMLVNVRALSVQAKANGNVFETIGKNGGVAPTTAESEIEKRAVELRKVKPDLSIEQAQAQIMRESPELYTRSTKEAPTR